MLRKSNTAAAECHSTSFLGHEEPPPLALPPLNNPSLMVELKFKLLLRTVELQIPISLKCTVPQPAERPVTRKE